MLYSVFYLFQAFNYLSLYIVKKINLLFLKDESILNSLEKAFKNTIIRIIQVLLINTDII